jgi:hypothetical protein
MFTSTTVLTLRLPCTFASISNQVNSRFYIRRIHGQPESPVKGWPDVLDVMTLGGCCSDWF